MLTEIKSVLKDSGTENNGTSYDFARIVCMFMIGTGFPTFLFLCVYSVIKHSSFDMVAYGTAFAGMLGGVAAVTGAVAFKQRTDTQ